MTQLKDKIIQEFKDELPKDIIAEVGYFDERQSSKLWLVSVKDLDSMYQKTKSGSDIVLWIDSSSFDESFSDDGELQPPRKKKKKEKDKDISSRQQKEDEVEDIYQELKSMHDSNYSSPQLKLWARMLHCGTHEDYEDPPRVPMITGIAPNKSKKDTFTEALTGAAQAVAKAFSPQAVSPNPVSVSYEPAQSLKISPGKCTDL